MKGWAVLLMMLASVAVAAELSDAGVENALRDAGFEEVDEIDMTTKSFTANVSRDGKDFRVEGKPIESLDHPREAPDEEVAELIERNGYQEVKNIKRNGNGASAEARDGDREVILYADLSRGLIWTTNPK